MFEPKNNPTPLKVSSEQCARGMRAYVVQCVIIAEIFFTNFALELNVRSKRYSVQSFVVFKTEHNAENTQMRRNEL